MKNKIKKIYFLIKNEGIISFVKKAKHSFLSNSEFYRRWIYKNLKKKYAYLENQNLDFPKVDKKVPSNKVWILWFQGLEHAPDLVKKCYQSVHSYLPNKEIILLTSDNLSQYIHLPDYIYEKYYKGIISVAHFSDIIRTACLVKNGGLWLDATVLLTSEIPKYYFDNELLFLQNPTSQIIKCSSWFMYSKYDNNKILSTVFYILKDYWKHEKKLKHYFMYHLVMSVVFSFKNNAFVLKKMTYLSNIPSHELQKILNDKLDSSVYEDIISKSMIHKLTYKLPVQILENRDNFYHYLISDKAE